MYKTDEFVPHFSLFTIVSSGKNTGSYGFEKDAIARHMQFYINYFEEKLGHKLTVTLNVRNGYTDKIGFIDRIHCHLRKIYPYTDFIMNVEETENSYYQGINFKITVEGIELVDGGFVDWTQKLLGNKKERLLISGTGIDLQLITGMLDKII